MAEIRNWEEKRSEHGAAAVYQRGATGSSLNNNGWLLALGDYKAKLVKDEHKTSYESSQVYEFLFPDKETRKFSVVGQTE